MLLSALLASYSFAGVALADTPRWNERRTLQFAVLYPDGADQVAERYAGFLDPLYEEAAVWWGYRPVTPVVVRIYPSMELYFQANPAAASVPGVVAHTHTGRREISIALPQTAHQSEEEVRNNIRHELTHIIAADLSGNKLSALWQEGVAQNAEHPGQRLDQDMQKLRTAVARHELLAWNDLDRRDVMYGKPELAYPESYAVVAFLIRRNGMPTFRQFVEAEQWTSDYHAALRSVYRTTPEQLEREWLAQMTPFVDGGYRTAPTSKVDLAPSQAAIEQGDYAGAIKVLKPLVLRLRSSQSPLVTSAASLLQRAEDGIAANDFAEGARIKLATGDYAAAERDAQDSERLFSTLGAAERLAVVRRYKDAARRGQDAQQQVEDAQHLLRQFRFVAARRSLATAYTAFTRLGDAARAGQAQAVLAALERGQQAVAAGMLACAGGVLVWNMWRRRRLRRQLIPFT
ncbi:MAG: peptidase MA family metallohydrolase [Herpetosiphon sp.]